MTIRMHQLRLKFRPDVCLAIAGLLFLVSAAPAQETASAAAAKPSHSDEKNMSAQSSKAASENRDETNGGITEEELKRALVGKPLFLRGGYLDDSLNYNEQGALVGGSAPAPYTLSAVQIEKVYLSKRKLQLVGARYGLHFLGALAYEDPTKAVDRVKITPKKKSFKITIDRELVVKPKKVKQPKKSKVKKASEDATNAQADGGEPGAAAPSQADVPADPNSPTTTTSPAHSATVLRGALDRIFAESIDERMIATMPDFWKLYYRAAAAKTDYKPTDSTVLRQNMVDQKAKLLTRFEPASNEFAQDHGVAGMSLYHVVIDVDGKPGEVAVARPIGFGLDENAVVAIRTAKFDPAMKDGKPVPVLLDLVVQFRIFSKRTAVTGTTQVSENPTGPLLPGPYSAPRP
jgi:outer membrane biosynthesis protein TonB